MKQKIGLLAGSVFLILFGVLFGSTSVCAAGNSTVNFYHSHTGNATSGGGCYGKKVSSSRECGSYSLDIWNNGQGSYNYLCKSCGNQWVYIYELQDAHCTNTITETHYEINCGIGNSALATLSCTKSTDGWTRELDLQASCQVQHSSFQLSATPYVWNGTASASGAYHVTQNGTYTLGIQASGADTSQRISVVVDHIDNQAPVIKEFSAIGGWAQSATIRVQAEDQASGLHADAYSYDGGASWTSESSQSVSENGTYSVIVRDAVGNRTSAETTVTTIDKVPPEVQITTSPAVTDWYDGNLTITVQAADAQSGLADAAYSFDGGGSFLVGNSYQISGNTELKIVVVDRAGNRTEVAFSAQKQVRPTKVPEPTKTPEPTKIPEPTKVPQPVKVPEPTVVPETPQGLNQAVLPDSVKEPGNTTEGANISEQTEQPQLTVIPNGKNDHSFMQGEVPKESGNSRKRQTESVDGTQTEEMNGQADTEDFPEANADVPILGQHYPKETWQGTPIRGNDGLKKKSEAETQTVILNELLAESLSTDVHTIETGQQETKGQQTEKWWIAVVAGIVAVIAVVVVMLAKTVIVVYAKDAEGRFRVVGVTTCRKQNGKQKIVITDAMLRRARTNAFRIHMPILMPLWKDGKMVVACHNVEREVPPNRMIQIRLRSE